MAEEDVNISSTSNDWNNMTKIHTKSKTNV